MHSCSVKLCVDRAAAFATGNAVKMVPPFLALTLWAVAFAPPASAAVPAGTVGHVVGSTPGKHAMAGVSLEECTALCGLWQPPAMPWSCRAFQYNAKEAQCDLKQVCLCIFARV